MKVLGVHGVNYQKAPIVNTRKPENVLPEINASANKESGDLLLMKLNEQARLLPYLWNRSSLDTIHRNDKPRIVEKIASGQKYNTPA